MKSKWIIFAAFSLTLVHCGFGGDGADPLNGHADGASYMTGQENALAEQGYETQLAAKKAEYDKSMAQARQESAAANKAVKEQSETLITSIQQQCKSDEAKWQSEAEKFQQQYATFETAQKAEVKKCESNLVQWQAKTTALEQTIANAEKVNIQGYIYSFDLERFHEISDSSTANIEIKFELKVEGNSLVSGIQIPDLPEGLVIRKGQNNIWTISGRPVVDFPAGKQFKVYKLAIAPVINYNNIKDEVTRKAVQREKIVEEMTLLITQSGASI